MRKCVALVFLLLSPLFSGDEQFYGKWDIKVSGAPPTRSWWLEVTRDRDGSPKGRFVGSGTGALDDTPDLAIRGGELSFSFERSARTFYSALPRDAPHKAALDGETRLVTGLYRARVVRGRLTGTFTIAGQRSPPGGVYRGTRSRVAGQGRRELARRPAPLTVQFQGSVGLGAFDSWPQGGLDGEGRRADQRGSLL